MEAHLGFEMVQFGLQQQLQFGVQMEVHLEVQMVPFRVQMEAHFGVQMVQLGLQQLVRLVIQIQAQFHYKGNSTTMFKQSTSVLKGRTLNDSSGTALKTLTILVIPKV
ncbi:hypothetical protein V6N12_060969 [Hibiscus sabdariffa]|uniref:Uncharacterized protein n=1 Tax=Hibiscus sabdariffa TaxID=183260 RepID=A0ABR2DVS4_9ROSI